MSHEQYVREKLEGYEAMPDSRLVLHIDWDSHAAAVWERRHGDTPLVEVLYPLHAD